jgi:hypothetical protein
MLGATSRQTNRRQHVIAPWAPLPWQVAPWRDRSPVVLLTGSAGGGKSRLAAEKLHGYCLKYPGATALLLRKARVSITNSSAELFKRAVIGPDPSVHHVSTKSRFEYRNGSLLIYAGLNDEEDRERLRSIGAEGGVDIAWMEEATEFDESDYNALIARMRGQAAHWRQILLTCNPDAPTHWIYRRLILGKEARVYYSRAADNRHNPADYQDSLGRLTGTDALRLAGGQWVQASGIIFDTWSDGPADGNVQKSADYIKDGGPIYWAMDDGYSAGSAASTAGLDSKTGGYVADAHPRVILLVQQRTDGRFCVFYESYACLRRSDDQIAEMLELPYPRPDYVIHGPGSAEIRGAIDDAGLSPWGHRADVEESIKVLRTAFAPDKNAWRKVLVHQRCQHLRRELASYRYNDKGQPVKSFDHGPDALRGLIFVARHF